MSIVRESKEFHCGCGNETLVVTNDYKNDMVDVAIYRKYKLSYWWKLKYALRLIFGGEMYHDQIVLYEKSLNEFIKFLNKNKQEEK